MRPLLLLLTSGGSLLLSNLAPVPWQEWADNTLSDTTNTAGNTSDEASNKVSWEGGNRSDGITEETTESVSVLRSWGSKCKSCERGDGEETHFD
jgi:hypothetical protein